MPPETGTALLILVGFLLPGFVAVLLRERTIESAVEVTQLDRILRISYYSIWSYLLVALAVLKMGLSLDEFRDFLELEKDNPGLLATLAIGVVLAPPFIVAVAGVAWERLGIGKAVRKVVRLNPHHLTPTAWDHFFSLERCAYVKVTLRDESRVGGYYGSQSFAAYAKDGGDLYLEETRRIAPGTDAFEEAWPGDGGLWVAGSEVVSIEFYNPDSDATSTSNNGQESQGRTHSA